MANRIDTVRFDADDTLWNNERTFRLTQGRFVELLADHAMRDDRAASSMWRNAATSGGTDSA